LDEDSFQLEEVKQMGNEAFPLVEMEGEPFDMGYRHGTEFRGLIHDSMDTYRRLLATDPWGMMPPGTKPTLQSVVELAAQSIPYAEDYAPEIVEEMRGIATGSGFSLEEIFALNASADILITLAAGPTEGKKTGGCSSYAVATTGETNGATYVGWNADDSEWWLKSSVLLKGKPSGGLPFLIWNFAGFVGRPGLNPCVAMAANGLFPADCDVGVPYPVICRKILQQRSVDEAISVIASSKRMSGMNYTLGDVDGNVAAIETTARKSDVIPGIDGRVAHTNHYLSEKLASLEKSGADGLFNSTTRLERVQEILSSKTSWSLGVDDLKALHCDHEDRPDSVCHHRDEAAGSVMTLTSLICDPKNSRMLVAYGHPCEHEFVEYHL
jgi:isopenicillin-N N-acyltransferase-like protein